MQITQLDQPPHKNSFWDTFTAAPHRIMFFAGSVQLIVPMIFWLYELTGLHTQLWLPHDLIAASSWLHGFIMLYGVFIFFIFGFLMTTFPRWMNGPLVEKSAYLATFFWCTLGIAIFEYGIFHRTSTAVYGLATFLFGWALGIFNLYKVYRASASKNKKLEALLLVLLLGGWLGAANFLIWLLTDAWIFVQISLYAGLWMFLIPLLFTVSLRMLPFFSSNVIKDYKIIQPQWMPYAVLALSIAHMQLSLNNLFQWTFLADLPMALIGLYLSYKWRLKDSLQNSLLAVLHLAFVWFSIGMLLFSIQSLNFLVNDNLLFGKAPIHAISIGFVSAMMVAMVTRVSLGHSGRKLHANKITVALFLGVQLTALIRILADIPLFNDAPNADLYIVAASLWLLCLGIWVAIYAPMYLRRRVDGQPG